MTNDPWALPTACFSIIVKAAAVDRSFPGGRDSFIASYRPAVRNGALLRLVAMSMDDVEHVLGELNDVGVIPGQDVAVGDMIHGPILECPGVVFTAKGEDLMPPWMVSTNPAPQEPPPVPSAPTAVLKPRKHVITIDYGYDTHSVEIDEEAFSILQTGEVVQVDGQGFVYDEEGWFEDHWTIDLVNGHVAFSLDNCAEFIGVRVWVDGSCRYEPQDVEYERQPPEPEQEPSAQPQPTRAKPQLSDNSQPRRVVFGSGPVHWLYDDDDGEDCDTAVLLQTPDLPPQTMQPSLTHTIRVTYTDSMLAFHGVYNRVYGEHSIHVDDETFRQIVAGEQSGADGQGFFVEDKGLVMEHWLFNMPVPGSAAFLLDHEDAFDAVDCWFDGVLQTRPPREDEL